MITEEMAGGDLITLLEKGHPMTLNEQAVRMIALQVSSALAHLHLRHSVAHCDVKPDNILCRSFNLSQLGSVKLCDFGLSQRFANRHGQDFTINVGTLEYFAPELVKNLCAAAAPTPPRPHAPLSHTHTPPPLAPRSHCYKEKVKPVSKYGPQVDMWALACVVYELLSGEPPFFSDDDDTQEKLILQGDLKFPGHFDTITDHGKGFIRRLLVPDVSRRPSPPPEPAARTPAARAPFRHPPFRRPPFRRPPSPLARPAPSRSRGSGWKSMRFCATRGSRGSTTRRCAAHSRRRCPRASRSAAWR